MAVGTHPLFGAVTLRWILVHLLEETARHAGHLDVIREAIDGRTGDSVTAHLFHVNVNCTDLDGALAFYRDTAGCSP